jgi:hypothetical protein
LYPVIDQWAHGAGLAAGALLGGILSPHARWVRTGRQLARGIAVVALGFMLVGGVRAARTSVEDSFSRLPRIWHEVGGVLVAAPATWTNDGDLAEPDGLVLLTVHRTAEIDRAAQLAIWLADTAPTLARNHGFDRVDPAPDRVIPLPAGWEGGELVASVTDAMGYRQRFRLIVCGRVFGGDLVTVVLLAPESIARTTPTYLARMLASIKPARPR